MKWIAALLLVFVGIFSVLATAQGGDERERRVSDYRNWPMVTATPVDMSPSMALSCIGPSKWDSAPNPHVPRVFLVFVNRVGEKAMRQKGRTVFPDGTVIVKEKHARQRFVDPAHMGAFSPPVKVDVQTLRKLKPELVTVMEKIKGKWRYFALGPDGKVIAGDTAYCGSCHEGNKRNDFVFRNYVPGAELAPFEFRR